MSKVVVFFAEGFEEIEGLTVVDMLRRAGVEVKIASIREDSLNVTGAHKIQIQADTYAKDVDFSKVDMVVLPGGMPGTTNLGACKLVTDTVKDFFHAGKFVAAICAAPSIFGDLGILSGKHAECYPGFEDRLQGATVKKEKVAVDGNVITSRGMGTAIEFSCALIEKLMGKEKAEEIARAIIYK